MRPGTGPFPEWLKSLLFLAGLGLFLPGMALALGLCCSLVFILGERSEGIGPDGVWFLLAVLLTLGAGGVLLWNTQRSMSHKSSPPLRLPPAWVLGLLFAFCLFLAILANQNSIATGVFFPLLLITAAALPALAAVSWFRSTPDADGLTWRWGVLAFIGGATVSIPLAGLIELLAPTFLFSFLLNRGDAIMGYLQLLLQNLTNNHVAQALTSRGFVIVLIELAFVAPLVEEVVKPLVTLPLLGRLGRREAFLVAALAGAGFAALENIIYASTGLYSWAGILLVRAVGGAIHPLGAGLVGLSWRDWLNGEREAAKYGFIRFGIAVGMHALWNGGSLLVVTLSGAQFFGAPAPELNLLGLSFAGLNLALLVVLGIAALWIGRTVATSLQMPWERQAGPVFDLQFVLSNRAAALWALACLAAILPAAVAALRLLLR